MRFGECHARQTHEHFRKPRSVPLRSAHRRMCLSPMFFLPIPLSLLRNHPVRSLIYYFRRAAFASHFKDGFLRVVCRCLEPGTPTEFMQGAPISPILCFCEQIDLLRRFEILLQPSPKRYVVNRKLSAPPPSVNLELPMCCVLTLLVKVFSMRNKGLVGVGVGCSPCGYWLSV